MEYIRKDLKVPAKYMKVTDGRICMTVNRNWLASLLNVGPVLFINHNRLTEDEIAAHPNSEALGPDWTTIYAKVYKKRHKNAIPLPRGRYITNPKGESELTFSQVLHYVADTNYRNLWKESYKKYYSPWNSTESREQLGLISDINDSIVMQEVLIRMYGCTLVQIQDAVVISISPSTSTESHYNLLPIIFAVETPTAFITLYEQTAKYSLRECVMYSPAALNTTHRKSLFLIYQLLRLSRDLYDLGLALGEITLSDILLMDNFTIQVLPKLSDNICLKPVKEFCNLSDTQVHKHKNIIYNTSLQRKMSTPFLGSVVDKNSNFGLNENIEKLCEMWVYHRISNFDYLTALNNIAGRRYGDPSCHHVMPWVTDFTSRCGNNWRDLTKSKFRLNKGDRQLDLTFDTQSTEVGHHVSDVLSEITYYVYLSRRYSKSVLCKHVRPLWVPGEYPASIQRLHEWSPDECIPQFFTDPTVFKSIHEDLPDLEVPAWATSPEDFIQKHRDALESLYISERLHHWIDLTFGYKLSGSAAIKSKNVCLQLVDNHTSLTNSGVVQLFLQPHPQKVVPSPYWSKIPPRLRYSVLSNRTKVDQNNSKVSDDEGHSSGFEEEELQMTISNLSRSSPLALSRLLSRSRGSLLSTEDNTKGEKPMNQIILLPKDYNPIAALLQVETMHAFINKVNHEIYKPVIGSHDSFSNYKQIVATSRIKEQQILGCLIVEIFLFGKFRATWNIEKTSFSQRLRTCTNILKTSPESLPKCVRNAVALLLQIDIMPKSYNINIGDTTNGPFRYPTITYMGLPPPSAHQFLQPILSENLFPSSKYCHYLYNIVEALQEYNSLIRELQTAMKIEDEVDSAIKIKMKYLCKISECKVKAIARELEKLLSHADAAREASLQLLVPYIQQIMEEPYSAVLAVWHLFDPVAKALGPKTTAETFLNPIMKLYEYGSIMDNTLYVDILPAGSIAKFKTTRLYHRSFLLKLMIRLGLRRFLDNFITPLVEAVGGYRDCMQGAPHTNIHRTGNLKTCDLNGACADGEIILSPLDEDSSADSEHNISSSPCPILNDSIRKSISVENDTEEVFTMETEDSSWISLNVGTSYNIDLYIDLNLNINDDLTEDGSRMSPSSSAKSPTIPIPKHTNSAGTKLVAEFNSIGCHVGSKTSSEDISYNETQIEVPFLDENILEDTCSATVEEKNLPVPEPDTDFQPNNAVSEEKIRQLDHIFQKHMPNECTVSEMSAESVIWLSHRLGPVLTARYLSRNLLRMLTLCYASKDNLSATDDSILISVEEITWHRKILTGDYNAVKVLECLTAIANLYGEQIILLQYFAHMVELLALCKRKLTQSLEGGLVSCLALFNHIIPHLSDSSIVDALHDPILKAILHPTIRILCTTRLTFPNGAIARASLAEKCLEAMFTLSLRLGSVITKNHLAVTIQRFFLIFDKSFQQCNTNDNSINNLGQKAIDLHCVSDNSGPQLWSNINPEVAESYSPPVVESDGIADPQRNRALEELKNVFTKEFAHKAYMLFYRHTNSDMMEQILKNHQHIWTLCYEYEQDMKSTFRNIDVDRSNTLHFTDHSITENESLFEKRGSSFGNISVIGNRFEIPKDDARAQPNIETVTTKSREPTSSISSERQLRGNWLAYWEHEIGRSDKDVSFDIKQIKLQNFMGHTNSVRCLHVLDNENSFMSGARDKSVKLWSLRSQGDGSTTSSCQYTYTGHKKSILALTFLESLRYAITCDGTIHCWDPFMGSLLGCPESTRPAPVNILVASPPPSTNLLVGTTDITLRIIDCRTFQYVNEMKVSMNPAGLIRCIAVSPSGYWVAMGQASGCLTILDIRTGLIIASWKGHECEILQLLAVNETTIISSSLDQTIAVWSALDGKLKFHMKGTTEPVHCMAIYEQELVIGTTASRIGVYTAVDTTASYSSSKLRSDAFKGVLTSMTVLPLNRLLLLGADNGGITLLC